MPKKTGTAREFVLQTLRQHADRELRIADLVELAAGRFQPGNLDLAVRRLYKDGQASKAIDPDRSVWWSVAGK